MNDHDLDGLMKDDRDLDPEEQKILYGIAINAFRDAAYGLEMVPLGNDAYTTREKDIAFIQAVADGLEQKTLA